MAPKFPGNFIEKCSYLLFTGPMSMRNKKVKTDYVLRNDFLIV